MSKVLCMQLVIRPIMRLHPITGERLVLSEALAEGAKIGESVEITFDWEEEAVKRGDCLDEERFKELVAQILTDEFVQKVLSETPLVLVELDSDISHDERVYDLQHLWEFAQGVREYCRVVWDSVLW